MAELVDDALLREVTENGELLGKTAPSRETKYSWFQVYRYKDEIIACVYDEDNGAVCGERITEDQLDAYIDPPKEETTTIPINELKELTKRSLKLSALENCGVENWAGYDYAMDQL